MSIWNYLKALGLLNYVLNDDPYLLWGLALLSMIKPRFELVYRQFLVNALQEILVPISSRVQHEDKILLELEEQGKLPYGLRWKIQSYLAGASVLPDSDMNRVEHRY